MTRAAVFEGFDAARAGDAGFHVVMVGPDATPDDVQAFRDAYELGLAWAEAEAALPEKACGLTLTANGEWGLVRNWSAFTYVPRQPTITGTGPTPAAALRSLAAKLKEGNG